MSTLLLIGIATLLLGLATIVVVLLVAVKHASRELLSASATAPDQRRRVRIGRRSQSVQI